MSYIPKDWRNEPDHSTPLSAVALEDLETRVTDYTDDRVDPVESGSAFLTTDAVTSQQNPTGPGSPIPVGSPKIQWDSKGNVLIGPNAKLPSRVYDYSSGANHEVFPDFFYAADTRKVLLRSMLMHEVNDPSELEGASGGGPTTKLATAVTLPVATMVVAYAGGGFPSSGALRVGNQNVAYTGKSLIATTTVNGAQTLSSSTPSTLTVGSATSFDSGTSYARVGANIIQYTGKSGTTLTGVTLLGGPTTAAVANGATASQHQFTGLTGGTGLQGIGTTVEFNNYPDGNVVGTIQGKYVMIIQGKGFSTPDATPPGSDTGGDFRQPGATINFITAQDQYNYRVGMDIMFATAPVQDEGAVTDNLTERLRIKADGTIVLTGGSGNKSAFLMPSADNSGISWGGSAGIFKDGTDSLRTNGNLQVDGNLRHIGSNWSVFGAALTTKPAVTGSRAGNAALASALTKLALLGLITDSSSA